MSICTYQDSATFYLTEPDGYANNRIVVDSSPIPVIFLQNTGFIRSQYRENIDSDAICYPDPTVDFIVENHMRLEGMYILAPLFDVSDDEGWYKVISVTVNRDHLLCNQIDNVELLLKKTRRPFGVS